MYYSDYYYDYTPTSGVIGTILAILGIWIFFVLAIGVFMAICNWIIYKKAGREGWESIIPIYNLIVEFKFLDIPLWVLVLLLIPGVNIAVPIIISVNLAKKFGKSDGFMIGLILLPVIFYPMLAFGDAKYQDSNRGIFPENNEDSRYCTYCGAQVNGNFCSKCGKEVK